MIQMRITMLAPHPGTRHQKAQAFQTLIVDFRKNAASFFQKYCTDPIYLFRRI